MNESIAYEIFLNQIGSSWILDSLYLFLITPLSIVGVFLNSLTFIGLCKTSNSKGSVAYFQYLKVYTLNSIVVCALLAFSFCTRSPRYFSFSYSYLSRFYRCKITYSLYAFYFYGNIIAILIKFERLSMLRINLKTFFRQNPYKLSFILFMIAFLISFPTFFVYQVKSEAEFQDAISNHNNKSIGFVYCGRSHFFETINGKLLFLIINIIRSFVTLLVEIIVSIIFIVSHRKFFHSKHRLLNNNNSFNNMDENLRLNDISSQNNSETHRRSLNFRSVSSKHIDHLNTRITLMTAFFSLISILGLIGSFLVVIIFLIINNGFIFHFTIFLNVFTVIIIYLLNFILLYAFNCNFRNYFRNIL